MTTTPEKNILGTAPIPRLLIKFAGPSIISMVVNALYNIVDQIFIGQGVGYLGNGATNVIFPMTVLVCALAFMISDGAAAYFSLKLGEGDKKSAEACVGSAIGMSIAAGILFTVCFNIWLEPLCRLFGATDNILPYAMDYGRIIVSGTLFVTVSIGLNACIRADGSPKIAMVSMLAGAIANTILDPIFIFVLQWGVKGAAVATVIGQLLSLLVGLWYIPRFKNVRVALRSLKPDFRTYRTISAYGASSFITQIAGAVCALLANNLLVEYGVLSIYGEDIPISVFGIVMKVNQILIAFIVGVALGSQPILGFNYGAGNLGRVKKTYGIAVVAATAVGLVGFVFFQFFPQLIINIFGSEDALYNEFAQKSFRIFLMMCPVTGFQIVTGIFFQAIGRPVFATIISMSRQILIMVPAMLLLPRFMGVEGILWAGPIAELVGFLFALILGLIEYKHLAAYQRELDAVHPAADLEQGGKEHE
jgi:putative MATE family efflux protein